MIKVALVVIAMLVVSGPAFGFEMTSGHEYGYINQTTVTIQGPVSTQAVSANENEATTRGNGFAMSGSTQENAAFAMKMGPVGVSNTSSQGGSIALSLGHGTASGENVGVAAAQTGTTMFDITKQGAGYCGRYFTINR